MSDQKKKSLANRVATSILTFVNKNTTRLGLALSIAIVAIGAFFYYFFYGLHKSAFVNNYTGDARKEKEKERDQHFAAAGGCLAYILFWVLIFYLAD